MDLWGQREVEYFGPAVIELDEEGTGTMGFEFVVASLDHRPSERGGLPAVEFSWDGGNGRKPATGRGWIAAAERDEIAGHFYVHKGVDSRFTAVRIAPGRR
jgi:hypothetical protein